MTLTQISTAGVKDDAVTAGKIPANAVGSSELADNAVDTAAIANLAITNDKINASAAIAGTKIADFVTGNTNNRVLTATGTTNSLNGEAALVFDGTRLGVGGTPSGIALDITKNTQAGLRITDSAVTNASYELRSQSDNTTKKFRIIDATTSTDRLVIDSSGRLLIGGAVTSHGSTNADDLQIGANNQGNQTGITLGSTSASSIRFADASDDTAGAIVYNHSNNDLTFFTGSGNQGKIDANGLTINSGHVSFTNGYGLNFSATSDGSGTSTSEVFHDYEEGEWTPALIAHNGGTAVTGLGRYTKIGDIVHAGWAFVNKDFSNINASMNTLLTGLPYQSNGALLNQQCSQLMLYGITFNANSIHTFYLPVNTTYLGGYQSRSGTTWIPWNTNDFRGAGKYLHGSITYKTNT